MQPHQPARRHLLGGLLAALFGWLLPRKAQAKPSRPSATPPGTGHTRVEHQVATVTYSSYDANGDFLASSPPLQYLETATYQYDSKKRVISVTYSSPPLPQDLPNA